MAAAMEYLFQSVQPIVIDEASRQIKQAFPEGLPDPDDLITVHMRWGDKNTEVQLLPVEHYVRGVQELIHRRQKKKKSFGKKNVHIYLASEDANAISAFQNAAPSHWKIHTSGPTQQPTESNSMGSFRSGVHGLQSMGALLVSLQANHYVLGTVSNWSRLINELRVSIVDSRCRMCTSMIDLHYGEWPTFGVEKLSFGSDFGRPTYSDAAPPTDADLGRPTTTSTPFHLTVTYVVTAFIISLFFCRRQSPLRKHLPMRLSLMSPM